MGAGIEIWRCLGSLHTPSWIGSRRPRLLLWPPHLTTTLGLSWEDGVWGQQRGQPAWEGEAGSGKGRQATQLPGARLRGCVLTPSPVLRALLPRNLQLLPLLLDLKERCKSPLHLGPQALLPPGQPQTLQETLSQCDGSHLHARYVGRPLAGSEGPGPYVVPYQGLRWEPEGGKLKPQ